MIPERWIVLTVRPAGAVAPAVEPSGAGAATEGAHSAITGAHSAITGAGAAASPGAAPSAIGSIERTDFDPDNLDSAGLFAEALVALGGRAVTESAAGFTTHLPEPPNPEAFIADARERISAWTGVVELEIEWSWQEQEDWAEFWKRGLHPRRITERVTIAPSWERPEPREDEIVITIDPGLAFGTAEHATTRGSIRLLDRTLSPGERVIDVGSGSGILAIAAARLGAGEVTAVEGDPYATTAAAENLELNAIEGVEIIETYASVGFMTSRGRFDGIIANIESGVLIPLLPGFAAALVDGGWVILSGILQAERDGFLEIAGTEGFQLVDEDREDEWWTARFSVASRNDRSSEESPAAP